MEIGKMEEELAQVLVAFSGGNSFVLDLVSPSTVPAIHHL